MPLKEQIEIVFINLKRKAKMNKLIFKKIALLIFTIVLSTTFFITGCSKKEADNNSETEQTNVQQKENSSSGQNTQTEKTSDKTQEHIMINLPTMQCGTCKKNIETAVKKLDGIENINVVVKEKVAHINLR
jgi:Heavy-metal-associated domain